MRDPNGPVIGPWTGHKVGAVVAATQSDNDACRVVPMPSPAVVAPVIAELRRQLPEPRRSLIHTRQHYDRLMPEIFLEELGVPTPVHMLDVGSASHAGQTTRVIKRIEQVPIEERPDPVIVPGDVSSAGHAVRTTRATKRIEPVLEAERPALVTLPGALSPHTLEPIPNIRRTLASTPSR